MISSVLALALLASAQQPREPSAVALQAFTTCLRTFMDKSIEDRMEPEAFDTALAGQCADQERALRAAVIQRELSFGGKRAAAEEDAAAEVDDARGNVRELFRAYSQPG